MAEETQNQAALSQGSTFVWHEVYVPKAADAVNFYSEALDFGTQTMPMGQAGTYTMLTRNGMAVAGIMGTSETPGMEQIPPHWSVYLSVDDVDARLAKCLELGAKLVVPPMDLPTVGRMCLIQDPMGAQVWLFKSANT